MNKRTQIALFLCCTWIVSLVYSPFALSMSMIGLLVLSLIRFPGEGSSLYILNTEGFRRLVNYRQYLSFLVIPLFFGIVLFSFWQTTGDYGYFLERLRIKLPFLLMPIAFLGLPRFTDRQVNHLLYFLLIFMVCNSIGIGVNYWMNYEEVQAGLGRGHAMPTPRNHIRYSLLTAVSIIGGIHLILQNYCWKTKHDHLIIKGLTFFVFLFIHVLSVKSGLVCLYFSLGVLLLRYIFLSKKYLLGIGLLTGLSLIPIIAYHSIPSLKQKVRYMVYDLTQYQKGKGGDYADAGRITSLRAGIELFQEKPIFGVGAGNFRRVIDELYAAKYPDYVQAIMPHNQFLFVLTGTGIFGLSFFLIAFFLPLFHKKAYQHVFFLGFYLLFLMAFILEHTIENAAGTGTFVFFVVLLLNNLQKESSETSLT